MTHAPVGVGGGGGGSCEAKTGRVRQRLVVRGGDLSGGDPSYGELVGMLPTGWKHVVLPVWVLTGVLSAPHLESWP
jgi:hypothetical protein